MFAVFCNYLRGVQDLPINSATNRHTSKSIKQNLKQFVKFLADLAKLFKLLFPKLWGVSTFLFILLLVDLVALEFVVYQVGLLSGKFFKVLTNKDLAGFSTLALYSIGLIIINSSMKSFNDFLARLLEIVWRKHITLKLHELYFTKKNFYYVQNNVSNDSSVNCQSRRINVDLISSNNTNESDFNGLVSSTNSTNIPKCSIIKNNRVNAASKSTSNSFEKLNVLDNIDQRITQDVASLCDSISNIVGLLLISPFVILWYGYQTYSNVGYSGPLAILIYFLIWGLINGPFTAPIARVVYKQDRREGDFRYSELFFVKIF
jgi:ABC-type uncharacterized transport system fused permease/ATPase subunit